MSRETKAVLWADRPSKWPGPPQWMSFYRLRDIESCPRRAALRSASYPEIWDRPGYPPVLHLSALLGQVVHSSVRTLSAKLAESGCRSASEADAVAVLTKVGGLSRVIQKAIETAFGEQSANPRGIAARPALRDAVLAHLPQIREQIQVTLSRLHFGVSSIRGEHPRRNQTRPSSFNRSYYEIELRAPQLGWVGVADYIGVFGDFCEIIDFKTGDPDEEHGLQLLVYALLWARDQKINPERRLANKLTISYRTGAVDVPVPSETELSELERQIGARTHDAREAISKSPTDALPSIENCCYCDVRHLCGAYWDPGTMRRLSKQTDTSIPYTDLQATIIRRHAAKCWKGVVLSSPMLPPEKPILLRTSVFDNSIDDALSANPGATIRVLGARLSSDPAGDSPTVLTMSEKSEAFLLRQGLVNS